MATIIKRGATFQARVRRKGIAVSQTFIAKAAAESWGRKIEHQIDLGTYMEGVDLDITLRKALTTYAAEVRDSGVKGWRQEKSRAKVLSRSPVATKRLVSITAQDIVQIRQDRLKFVSKSTVRRDLGTLSAMYHRAIEVWQYAIKNPMIEVKRPPQGKSRDRRLRPGELVRILAATQSIHLPDAINLALATAMRRGELAPTSSKSKVVKGVLYLADTKNGHSRHVPITTAASAALFTKKATLPGSITLAFSRAVKRARKIYEGECLAAGVEPEPGYLEDLRFHDLRHEATSRLFEAGLNIMEASAVTGHKSLQMLKRYTHLDASTIANKLNDAAKLRG